MTKFKIGDIVYDSYKQPYKNWEDLVKEPYTIKKIYEYTNTTDYLIESDKFQGLVNEKDLYETAEEAYSVTVRSIANIEQELRGKLKTIADVVAIYTNPNKYTEELKEKISREVVKKKMLKG